LDCSRHRVVSKLSGTTIKTNFEALISEELRKQNLDSAA
jgi:hypothetical protein